MRKLGLLLLLGLSGCGGPPEEPTLGASPLSSPALVQGRQVFMAHCNQCHPRGEAGLGPALNDFPAPGFLVELQVRHGFGAMPDFDERQISPEQLDALVEYLLVLREAN